MKNTVVLACLLCLFATCAVARPFSSASSLGGRGFAEKAVVSHSFPAVEGRVYIKPQSSLDFLLQVTDVKPTPAVEHSPIAVKYQLTVNIIHVGGDDSVPLPQTVRVCAQNQTGCVTVRNATAGQTYTGTVATNAPAAAAAAPVRLSVFYDSPLLPAQEFSQTQDLADADIVMPVFARYDVAVDGFKIRHTRAIHNDTVKIDLRAMVPGQPSDTATACNIVGPPTYCVMNVQQGDHNDGQYQARGARVGPYDLIPDITDNLTLSYNVMNLGTPYELRAFKKIMDGISDAAYSFISAYSGNSNSYKPANDFTHYLNNLQWGGCDGPVAVDMFVMLNKAIAGQDSSTLDARTRSTGRFQKTSGTYSIDSQDGCGDSPRYDITWSVIRTSWQAP